jgi:hypothetical protein
MSPTHQANNSNAHPTRKQQPFVLLSSSSLRSWCGGGDGVGLDEWTEVTATTTTSSSSSSSSFVSNHSKNDSSNSSFFEEVEEEEDILSFFDNDDDGENDINDICTLIEDGTLSSLTPSNVVVSASNEKKKKKKKKFQSRQSSYVCSIASSTDQYDSSKMIQYGECMITQKLETSSLLFHKSKTKRRRDNNSNHIRNCCTDSNDNTSSKIDVNDHVTQPIQNDDILMVSEKGTTRDQKKQECILNTDHSYFPNTKLLLPYGS